MSFLGTMYRVLVVLAVVVVGNTRASERFNKASDYVFQSRPGKLLNDNRCTLMGSVFVNKMINKDDLLTKAAVETTFYALNNASLENGSVDLVDIDLKDAAEHFLLNVAIRKAGQEFGKRVITLDAAAKKCDGLPVPAGVKYYLDPVVREVAEQTTEPEMLMFITWKLMPMVVSMLASKKS